MKEQKNNRLELEAIREIKSSTEIIDMKGMEIPANTILHVIKVGPKHPRDGHRVLVVRVDNGTGHLDLMPETTITSWDEQIDAVQQ